MNEADIPDLNVFMMCTRLNDGALRELPAGYHIRSMRPDELGLWKAFPFDDDAQVRAYDDFMTRFFHATYGANTELFFKNTLFACDSNDRPIATCSSWKAYDAFQSIHWWKTLKLREGRGIGRALLSVVMQRFASSDYPIYLHTQPGSFRAIKLYSDFGFELLRGEQFGTRPNHLSEYMPILEKFMPPEDFSRLRVAEPPPDFLRALLRETTAQF